jgi:hypothetical protein
MNLRDIDHRAINEYTNFDGRKATCGKCEGAIIKMNISTCATDENGSPLPNCVTNANVDKITTINNVVYNDNGITIWNTFRSESEAMTTRRTCLCQVT